MNQYFSSYVSIEANPIAEQDLAKHDFYFKISVAPIIDCRIAEEYFGLELNWVIYYAEQINNELIEYHKAKYGNIKLSLCSELNKNTIRLINYENYQLNNYLIMHYDDYGKQILSQTLNSDLLLIEYFQTFYDENGERVYDKIFYPKSWTIHQEDRM